MDPGFFVHSVMDPVIAAALRSHRQQQVGRNSLPYFSSPVAYQRGRGLGSLVRALFRPVKTLFKKPIVRKGLKKLGTAAAHALVEAGKEALTQEDVTFGNALKKSSKQQAQDLLKQVQQNMTGKGGKRKRLKLPVSKKQDSVKKARVELDSPSDVEDIFSDPSISGDIFSSP